MTICSCASYQYKQLEKEDPLYWGWGTPWLDSQIEHPAWYGDFYCECCGDLLTPNGIRTVFKHSEELEKTIVKRWLKNHKTYHKFRAFKIGGWKGLKGVKSE